MIVADTLDTEISEDEQKLVETLREHKLSAADVKGRIDKAVQEKDKPSAPAAKPDTVTRAEMEKTVQKAVGAVQEQQQTATARAEMETAIGVLVAKEDWMTDDPVERQAVMDNTIRQLRDREDITKLNPDEFRAALRETAEKSIAERKKTMTAKAEKLSKANPPSRDTAAKAHGQTNPGETPPRSDVESSGGAGDVVTAENLSEKLGSFGETTIWPSESEQRRDQHTAAKKFLREAATKN